METIELIYKRLPDRVNHFPQNLLYEDDDIIVTTQRIKPSSPIVIDGVTVLGDNYRAVWFVFANRWYDIGKIYNLKNHFTGYYCDIILPMKRTDTHFEITIYSWICGFHRMAAIRLKTKMSLSQP